MIVHNIYHFSYFACMVSSTLFMPGWIQVRPIITIDLTHFNNAWIMTFFDKCFLPKKKCFKEKSLIDKHSYVEKGWMNLIW